MVNVTTLANLIAVNPEGWPVFYDVVDSGNVSALDLDLRAHIKIREKYWQRAHL